MQRTLDIPRPDSRGHVWRLVPIRYYDIRRMTRVNSKDSEHAQWISCPVPQKRLGHRDVVPDLSENKEILTIYLRLLVRMLPLSTRPVADPARVEGPNSGLILVPCLNRLRATHGTSGDPGRSFGRQRNVNDPRPIDGTITERQAAVG